MNSLINQLPAFSIFRSLVNPQVQTEEPYVVYPAYNHRETDTSRDIVIDLPGVNKTDVQVKLEEDQLFVQANRKHPFNDKATIQYQRVFTLPTDVGTEVSARLDAGVLYLTLPKAPKATGREIVVQ